MKQCLNFQLTYIFCFIWSLRKCNVLFIGAVFNCSVTGLWSLASFGPCLMGQVWVLFILEEQRADMVRWEPLHSCVRQGKILSQDIMHWSCMASIAAKILGRVDQAGSLLEVCECGNVCLDVSCMYIEMLRDWLGSLVACFIQFELKPSITIFQCCACCCQVLHRKCC